MNPLSNKLITWYIAHKRDLPWRNTTDPYKIWLSEIILQQTQVIQGLNYYIKFIEAFPTVSDLADAPEDLVMKLWQGLGYYSRARNLHAAAKFIKVEFNGIFPPSYSDILKLKGVGDYTAAAIASFAFHLPYAVVDGNVYRVLARLFDIHIPINSSKGKKEFQLLANELLDKKRPALHNSAIMEFGALWCKPQNPKCEECVLQEVCFAFKNKTIGLVPVKDKKTKIRARHFNYIIFKYKNDVYIHKRLEKDIWQNLYEFYLIESPEKLPTEALLEDKRIRLLIKNFKIESVIATTKHILSHQHIFATFHILNIDTPLKSNSLIKIKKSELINYAFPQLINKYLEKLNI